MELFANISSKNKEKLLKLIEATSSHYQSDVNILSGTKPENYIGIIDYGCVQITMNDYNGNRTLLEELTEGDIFGTMLFPIKSDECSIITKGETKITFIDYDMINDTEIVKTEFYIQFIRNLLNIVTSQVVSKNERIQILTKRSIRDKILEYFRILANGSRRFEIPFSFTEMANYLCIDRSAMTRELTHLKNEKFIKINNRQITLLF